jgi:hypothetical protein
VLEAPERLDALVARAMATLSIEASEEANNRLEGRLQSVAAELALEWITGERRFENQSQQTEHWLARLYEEIYADEQPDAGRIYARFTLPLPRAQYLARLLFARRTAQWRDAAHKEVLAELKRVEPKALEAEKMKAASTQRFDLNLSRGAYDQLVVLYDFLAKGIVGEERPAPPKKIPSSAALTWFSLTAETLLALLKLLRENKT